jgi:N-acetylglucosamine malate deacetylase 1
MENITNKRVLVLAPHTDDAEFGCGGSIAKMIEQGNEVFCVAFSACQQSVRPEFPQDILLREVKAASGILGIKPENLFLHDYAVRTFNFRRQEILDDIIKLKTDIKPDLVFVPSVNDIHQDHYTIAQEAVRAFKFSSILSYELPWNNFEFKTTCFILLEERHLQKKITAVNEYKSQAHRAYANESFVRSLAITRGVQVGSTLAEVFEIVRWIL